MKKIYLFIFSILFMSVSCNSGNVSNNTPSSATDFIDKFAENGYTYDSFTSPSGKKVNIVFIKHGSIVIDIKGYMVYIDPVTMFGNDFSVLPKADLILVTHEHHDHLDAKAIDLIRKDNTKILSTGRVAELYGDATPLEMNTEVDLSEQGLKITTVPAYNTTEGHLDFHPKARGDFGYILDVEGLKIYIAGDTEDIPEMKSIGERGIDVAFIPVNQPYTMTPDQAINAVEMLRPKTVYPYHYGNTDLTPIVNKYSGSDIEVRIRALE